MAKTTAKQFLEELRGLGEQLRQEIEASVSGFDPDPVARDTRRAKAKASFQVFVQTYFPHYVSAEPSVMHTWLFERLPRLGRTGMRGVKLALAAPRGEAKSTLVTQLFVLWSVVMEQRWFIPIIMDAFDQSAAMLEAVKAELDSNPRLAMDFPEATGQGRVWREGVILTTNNRKVQAFGSGKRMRGLRHGPHRPDLVVLDDIENDENVQSPAQRDKVEAWVQKTVLKLGPPDGSMDVVWIGTILHHDSALARAIASPRWESKKFQAILRLPDRMDLWDEWEALLLNDGEEPAETFYYARKDEMDRGAEVSWPSQRPLYALMLARADDHDAFDSEYQNDPLSSEGSSFANLVFWVKEDPEWIFFGSVDPSLGKLGKGRDPSAILVGGYNRKACVLDVVEASIAKRLPDRIIEDMLALQLKYRCLAWVVESVQFQEFFRTELIRRGALRGIPMPARPTTPNTDKDLRIASLQPYAANGQIRIHPSQKTLLEQLRHWPKADHDDGPDALEMLWKLASGASAEFAYAAVAHRTTARDRKGAY